MFITSRSMSFVNQGFWVLLLAVLSSQLAGLGEAADAWPRLHDERLELKLFAADPDIVTPIGMAIDGQDRIFVIESHTHTPPAEYAGPKGDIIKVFRDADNDGVPDRQWNFATDVQEAMNLAFAPDGRLFAVCAREVWMFEDHDGDGISDGRKRVLQVDTSNKYSHSCQLGITFSRDGWMYISRGNNGSAAYRVLGTDGSRIEGWGDGGNIYRCRPDGSQLEQVATGFWNPFDLKFDSRGRLLAVDNDPDARGPNRLVHVIESGDYGYKSMYGGGGNHPFQGWDGTLPGTLGYVAGTGEAPSGLIDANRTSLPADYSDQYLVTIWNENSIARFAAQPRGKSISATQSVWIQGDANFRPVALDADSRGNLFFSDWVKVDYPNHGRGRIWRVSTRTARTKSVPDSIAPLATLTPRGCFDAPLDNSNADELADLLSTTDDGDFGKLVRALASDDPFVRHASVVALSRPVFLPRLPGLLGDGDATLRLGVLLAMRRGGISGPERHLKQFLADPDEQVRRAALMWVGEAGMSPMRPAIDQAIAFVNLSATLFETYLAAVETLDPDFVAARLAKAEDKANRLQRRLDPALLRSIASDESRPDRVRALALIHLKDVNDAANLRLFQELVGGSAPILRREAIRSLAEAGRDFADLFVKLAKDASVMPDIRAEALLALSQAGLDRPEELLSLLDDSSATVRFEATRTLRAVANQPTIQRALSTHYARLKDSAKDVRLIEELEYALHPPGSDAERVVPRPGSIDDWHRALQEGGDPAAGERVFFSRQTQCAACHLIHNRGRRIGPELSNVGQSMSRAQIIHSILKPSDQFPPQYQAWFVELEKGDIVQGLQLDHQARGDIDLFTAQGVNRRFRGREIARYGVLPNSLMPDGLEQTMTVGEFRDLVAFLSSLK